MKFTLSELKEFKAQMLTVKSEKILGVWEKLIVTPPILVRLMARTREKIPKALTDDQIAAAGGFKISEVFSIYPNLVWNSVSVTDARRFMQACNCDIMEYKEWNIMCGYVLRRSPRWFHIKRSPLWDAQFHPMLQAWEQAKAFVNS